MNTATFRSSCLLTVLGLATTATMPACSVAADTKSLPPAPATAPVAPTLPKPLLPGGGGMGGRSYSSDDLERRIAEVAERAREAQSRSNDAFGAQEAQFKLNDANALRFASANVRQSPALIVTHELTVDEKSEWSEDLTVMGKLLRDQLDVVSNDEEVLAMGIRVWASTPPAPMYIDGCGALFTYNINIPLAASGKAASAPATRESLSAWERAKRDLAGSKVNPKPAAPPQFDRSVVENLTAALAKTMLQASNMRHLPAGEYVIVTVTGVNDAGAQRRLTMRVRKSDIDDAEKNNLSVESFSKLVASNIN